MTFKDIRNNDNTLQRFMDMARSGRVPHAFILESPAHVDKYGVAVSFAQALLCQSEPGIGCGVCATCRRIKEGNHLDVTVIEATSAPGTKAVSVKDKDVSFLLERLGKKPVEGDRNIAILRDADTMTARAFNHLLKTLEEPGEGTVIMLLSENQESLPPTIRSRCVQIRILPFADEEANEAIRDAGEYCRLVDAGENYLATKELLNAYNKDRQAAMTFLDATESYLGDALATQNAPADRAKGYRRIEAVEQTRDEIKRGANIPRALNKMTITMGETK